MRRLLPLLVFLALVLPSRTAWPCGPGVHVREADKAYDAIAAADADWAGPASDPLARSYLRLGSISPDFAQMSDELGFGHEFALSYHLLDAAAGKGPLFRMFALGHLAHANASDSACEMFLAPTMAASAPIGILDLTKTYDGPNGESEGVFETFGDFVLGDWDAVVDTLYDFWMGGDEAKARAQEVFAWYCAEGKAFLGRSTDCDKAWGQVAALLVQADQVLGNLDRDEAKEFLHSLIDQPLPDLAALYTGGFVQQVLGGRIVNSDDFDREYQRFLTTAIVTDAYWLPYGGSLGELGPAWAADRLANRTTGFPSWTPNALTCGNVESMMQYLPDRYQVVPGLIVDDLRWQDADGATLGGLSPADAGKAAKLVVRFYSAYPFTGTVKGVVRKDLPGLDPTDDPTVAEGSAGFDIDPLEYTTTPRSTLEVPFTVDTAGALGLYAELWVEGGTGPWFTTSWDRLWQIPQVDVDRPAIRNNFGTYGFWPPSLRIDPPDVTDSTLFVKVRVAPAGGGIDQAEVVVGDPPRTKVTGWNGIAVFDQAGTQPVDIRATAAGFADAGTGSAQPVALENTWVTFRLHGIPRVGVPGPWQSDRTCVGFRVSPEPFQGQVDRFLSRASTVGLPAEVQSAPVEAVPGRDEKTCFDAPLADGTQARVAASPRYLDGSTGVEGVSTTVGIDGSAPEVSVLGIEATTTLECTEIPAWKTLEVRVLIAEPHSPLGAIEWRFDDGTFAAVEGTDVPGELPGTRLVTFWPWIDLQPQAVSVRATNAAGLAGESTTPVPSDLSIPLCPPELPPDPGPDVAGDASMPERPDAADAVGADPGATDVPLADVPSPDAAGKGGGGGCQAGAAASGLPPAWMLLAIPLLAVAKRRRRSRRS